MSKTGYALMLAFLTLGLAFAGCIVEYDANEAGAGASTGGANATGGTSAKGGTSNSAASTSASSDDGGGCSLAPRRTGGSALGWLALSLGCALSVRRRCRAAG